jgi:hypothetical protein
VARKEMLNSAIPNTEVSHPRQIPPISTKMLPT